MTNTGIERITEFRSQRQQGFHIQGGGIKEKIFYYGQKRNPVLREDALEQAIAYERNNGVDVAPAAVDPVLGYVRRMRRDDTTNPGPRGTGYRRGGPVVFKQAEAMPGGTARGEYKGDWVGGGEILQALIKEFAARRDGQEPLAITMAGESAFADDLAKALGVDLFHEGDA
jgi:hypothetical protein